MSEEQGARDLASSIVAVAGAAGLPTVALLTDMNEVLGGTAGNALEILETIDYLSGARRDARLHKVTIRLAAEMLLLGRLAATLDEAHHRAEAALASGAAAERFARMVVALGGPSDLLERPRAHLAAAPCIVPLPAPRGGHVARIDVRRLGIGVVELGGGRRRVDEAIDHAVGLSEVMGTGATVGPDRPLALIHARRPEDAARAAAELAQAFVVEDMPPPERPLIHPCA
jgi:thymidine phosphorylase